MTRRTEATRVSRAGVLAYRAQVHDLEHPVAGPLECRALLVGIQDYPVGASAHLALGSRVVPEARPAAPIDTDGLTLVHSVRGAAHLHRADDLDVLAASLRLDHADDAAPHALLGTLAPELTGSGIEVGAALDEVAAAMREAMADGEVRTKGELSGAIRTSVDRRLRPWCEGCGVDHVHDGLFRLATLQAGLTLAPGRLSDQIRYLPPGPASRTRPDPAASRCELVRRFLRFCGPATHHLLAAWLGLRPAAARRLWQLVDGDLVAVEVDGRRAYTHAGDLEELRSASAPVGVRLLAPYDPLVAVADREFLVPDPARRREVWRAAANPGVLLVAGEVAGTWRRRTTGGRVVVSVRPFQELSDAQRQAAATDGERMVGPAGAATCEVHIE